MCLVVERLAAKKNLSASNVAPVFYLHLFYISDLCNLYKPFMFLISLTFRCPAVSTDGLVPLLLFCFFLLNRFFFLATFSFPLLKGKWPLSYSTLFPFPIQSLSVKITIFSILKWVWKKNMFTRKTRH